MVDDNRLAPTEEDLALDVREVLATSLGRLARNWEIPPSLEAVLRVVAGLSRRLIAAEADNARLREIVAGLADRVAAQSDLLSRRAERGGDA